MGSPGFKRRRIIVDKKLQFGLSATIVVALTCYLLLFCLISVYSPFATLIGGAATEAELIRASSEIDAFVRNLLWPIVLTFACLGMHCVLLTHRIAGPAYRLKRTFLAVRERDLSLDIHLREHDYMGDVAEGYNAMMGGLRRDIGAIRAEVGDLSIAIRDLTGHTAGPAANRTADLLARAERLADRLGEFRLGDEADDAGETGAVEPAKEAVEA
jgi:methyl-accepting chemotaxis protein